MEQPNEKAGFVEIDLNALIDNYERLREQASGSEVGAVVKANAYGLGAVAVSRRLAKAGCRAFFVATLEEGLELRAGMGAGAGHDNVDIYVFEGPRRGKEQAYIDHELVPALNTPEQLRAWQQVQGPAVLHVDTGMNRLGLSTEDIAALQAEGFDFKALDLRFLMTHLACADEAGHAQNEAQIRTFTELKAQLGIERTSIGNSAAIYLGSEYRGDLARAGIALYGGNPFSGARNPMQPVARLMARILQIRAVERSAYVGYGATWPVSPGRRLAVVGVGYADGYPRALGNRAQVSVQGQRAAVVGRVSMDLTCIDISAFAADEVNVGDYIEMFGRGVSVDVVAEMCSTISYEILTGLNTRLARYYTG